MDRRRRTLLLALLVALTLASTCAAASPLGRGASYLLARQQSGGGFAEPGASSSAGLTAWVVLGLRASGKASGKAQTAADYIAQAPAPQATDLELRLLAGAALGRDVSKLADQIEQLRRPSGRIGPALNSTYWGLLALRAAGRKPAKVTVRYILRAQRKNGGWSWSPRAASDAGDSAAAIQALRSAGASARTGGPQGLDGGGSVADIGGRARAPGPATVLTLGAQDVAHRHLGGFSAGGTEGQ